MVDLSDVKRSRRHFIRNEKREPPALQHMQWMAV